MHPSSLCSGCPPPAKAGSPLAAAHILPYNDHNQIFTIEKKTHFRIKKKKNNNFPLDDQPMKYALKSLKRKHNSEILKAGLEVHGWQQQEEGSVLPENY